VLWQVLEARGHAHFDGDQLVEVRADVGHGGRGAPGSIETKQSQL